MRHWSRRGAARARGGLLTGRGRGRPGSAEEAAEHPERQRCPAAGSRSRHHPRRAGRGTPRARGGDAARLSVGFSRRGGLCAARERAGPLPLRPLLPAPLQAPVRPGCEPRGKRSLPLPSERLLPLAPGASEMPGGRNSNGEGKGGGAEEGTYPALSLWGGGVEGTTGRGGRREERGLQARRGECGARRCRRWHCGRALPAPPGGVTRRGSRPPVSSRGGLGRGEHAAPRAGGRAHARPQRGAARGGISPAPEQQRWQQRPETELETPPPPAAPAHPGGGRGGEALPPRPLQSPPRLLLLLHLPLTVPLRLSEPSCPALASIGSRSAEAPTGPGPLAGAGAEQGGARLSPGGRRC